MAVKPFSTPSYNRPPVGVNPPPIPGMPRPTVPVYGPTRAPVPPTAPQQPRPPLTQTYENPFLKPVEDRYKLDPSAYYDYQALTESKNRQIYADYLKRAAPLIAEFNARYGSQNAPEGYVESIIGKPETMKTLSEQEYASSVGYVQNPYTQEYVRADQTRYWPQNIRTNTPFGPNMFRTNDVSRFYQGNRRGVGNIMFPSRSAQTV